MWEERGRSLTTRIGEGEWPLRERRKIYGENERNGLGINFELVWLSVCGNVFI